MSFAIIMSYYNRLRWHHHTTCFNNGLWDKYVEPVEWEPIVRSNLISRDRPRKRDVAITSIPRRSTGNVSAASASEAEVIIVHYRSMIVSSPRTFVFLIRYYYWTFTRHVKANFSATSQMKFLGWHWNFNKRILFHPCRYRKSLITIEMKQ